MHHSQGEELLGEIKYCSKLHVIASADKLIVFERENYLGFQYRLARAIQACNEEITGRWCSDGIHNDYDITLT